MTRGIPGAVVLLAALTSPAAAQNGSDWNTDFEKHTVPLEEIVPGGPPKDGIPAIDRPRFVSVDEADDWLDERDPVMVVDHGSVVRAYPLQILIWHEIVNDRVGGLPVAVTYCPLCNTALVFDRRLDGRVLDFGTTGMLRHSDMVMYDRQTESWWQQATGEGIVGELAGWSLEAIPSPTLDWETVRELHPGAQVLSRETGHRRPYGRSPYAGYDRSDSPIASFFRRETDRRLPAMERVAAVRQADVSVAFPFGELRKARVANDEIAERAIVVFWAPGAASAVDTEWVAVGRNVGATSVWSRVVDGRTLTFEPVGDGRFRDRETGSFWSMAGRADQGPLEGKELVPVAHGDFFWFAWAVFRPATRIWRRGK